MNLTKHTTRKCILLGSLTFVIGTIVASAWQSPMATAQSSAQGTTFGRLHSSKSRNTNGRFSNSHSRTFQKGKRYVIDLQSSQFDPVLGLYDSQGNRIAVDDDSGQGLNARIRFTPSRTGTYRLVVTSFGKGMQGQYTLQIRQQHNAPLGLRPQQNGKRPPNGWQRPRIRNRCDGCRGVGSLRCSACGGDGIFADLFLPDGRKIIRCDCNNGRLTCPICNGTGR